MTAKVFLAVVVAFCAVQGLTAETRSLSDWFSGFQNITAEIKDKVGQFQDEVKEKAEDAINKAKSQIAEIKEDVKEKATEIEEKVKQFEEAAKEKISSQFGQNATKNSKRDLFLDGAKAALKLVGNDYRVKLALIKQGYNNAVRIFTGKMDASTNALENTLNNMAAQTAAQFKDVTVDVSECYNAQKENNSKVLEQAKSQVKDLIAYENKTYIQSLLDKADAIGQQVESLAAEGQNCTTTKCVTDTYLKGARQLFIVQVPEINFQLQINEVKANMDANSKLQTIIQAAIAEGKKNQDATAQCVKGKESA